MLAAEVVANRDSSLGTAQEPPSVEERLWCWNQGSAAQLGSVRPALAMALAPVRHHHSGHRGVAQVEAGA